MPRLWTEINIFPIMTVNCHASTSQYLGLDILLNCFTSCGIRRTDVFFPFDGQISVRRVPFDGYPYADGHFFPLIWISFLLDTFFYEWQRSLLNIIISFLTKLRNADDMYSLMVRGSYAKEDSQL